VPANHIRLVSASGRAIWLAQCARWSTNLAASTGLAAAPAKGECMGYDGRKSKRPCCKDGKHSMLRFIALVIGLVASVNSVEEHLAERRV
jgi:hypothetical protein